jgi:hypothetical protein
MTTPVRSRLLINRREPLDSNGSGLLINEGGWAR